MSGQQLQLNTLMSSQQLRLNQLRTLFRDASFLNVVRAVAFPLIALAAAASTLLPTVSGAVFVAIVSVVAMLLVAIPREYLTRRKTTAYTLLVDLHNSGAVADVEYEKMLIAFRKALQSGPSDQPIDTTVGSTSPKSNQNDRVAPA